MSVKFDSIFTNQIEKDINGVINADAKNELAEEFKEYVITNEVSNCLDGFFEKYNEQRPVYNGVWISGFFGCGKSHLLKILSYLISNTEIEEEKRAVSYFDGKLNDNPMLFAQMKKATSIPSESILFNIVQYNQNNQNEPILHIFQRKFYEHCGYYGINPKIAAFEMELDKEGLLDKFKETLFQNSGKVWEDARKKPNINNRHIVKAFAEITGNTEDPDLLDSYEAEISIHDFATQVKEYIDSKGSDFRLNFCVDEVGQFVAHSSRLMVDIQEIASSLSSVTGNRSWVLVTSQDELEKFVKNLDKQDKTDISKIQGRFYVKMPLSNANVNEVIQKRLLEKNEEGKNIVGSTYEIQKENFNTLFQFVNGPKKYRVYRDKDEFVTTYPFVTYQFDMFKSTLETLSLHNAFPGEYTSTGARSMLDVFHNVLRDFTREDGAQVGSSLIPYDAMYDGLKDYLKENFKRSVDMAENNIIDNPFAIRVLKALLLVKYLQKEFKPTAHNLSVLLLTRFDTNPAELVEKTEEALNRLTNETYIQRNGDTYDFLTNEEKDVEEEIKQTFVPPKDLTDEINNIIYGNILTSVSKASDGRNVANYQFTKKIDNETVTFRNSEISVNILSPFQSGEGHPNYSDTISCPDTELVVLLRPDKHIADDLLLYLKTNQYVKNHTGEQLSEDRSKVIEAKADKNKDRKKEIESELRDMLSNADFYIAGTNIGVVPSTKIDTRFERGFEILIEKVYPNLRMVDKNTASEVNAKTLIDKNNDDELIKDISSEAETQIINVLRQNKNKLTTTIANLMETFRKKPYGWPESALIFNLILLVKKSQINIKINGSVTDNPQTLKNSLFSTSQYGYIVIELCKDIDPKKIKAVKEFIYDLSGHKCTYDDAKSVSKMALEEIDNLLSELKDKAYSVNHPFVEDIKNKMKVLIDIKGKDYLWYFSDEFTDGVAETILDDVEDHYNPFLKFMNKSDALSKYVEASNLIRKNLYISDQLDKETWQAIVDILNDKNIYRKSTVSQLPSLMDKLKIQISSMVTEARNNTLESYEEYIKAVQRKSSYKLLTIDQRELLNTSAVALKNKIISISTLDGIKNIVTFDIPSSKRTIEAILEAGEAKAKEKKIIKLNSLSSARIYNPINTVEGVKEYIRKLEDEMTRKINEGYTVE